MENGYENFVDTLRQSLLKETSYEEEMIYNSCFCVICHNNTSIVDL